jgi:hypothetical protein
MQVRGARPTASASAYAELRAVHACDGARPPRRATHAVMRHIRNGNRKLREDAAAIEFVSAITLLRVGDEMGGNQPVSARAEREPAPGTRIASCTREVFQP